MSEQDTKEKLIFYDGKLGKIIEVRAADGDDQGVVVAYLTEWDTVDSWGTSFKKGAFKATFASRGASGTRLIWNHKLLAGKILNLKEDATGPLATVQFNLRTTAGKEAYEHVKAGDITCFSFGFFTLKDRWNGQIREILEVDMLECGPVVFESNASAKIVDVRAHNNERMEQRAEDFDETQRKRELSSRGWQLLYSLEHTIDDIYYSGKNTANEIISKVDTAISQFHTAYIAWLNEYYAEFSTRENGTALEHPCAFKNKLQLVTRNLNPAEIAQRTSLTEAQIVALKKGQLLDVSQRGKLAEISPEVVAAHAEVRTTTISGLCDEVRSGGLTPGDVDRVSSLLDVNKSECNLSEIMSSFVSDIKLKLGETKN